MNAESMRRRAMQCMHPRVLGAAAVLAACVAVLPVACAQGTSAQDTTTSAQDDSLSPARVGRLADLAGDVYLAQQDHADDWSPVDENYPVTSGDNLWTSDNARAEVDFGGSQMRMWASTNVNVATLDSHALEIFVAQGSILLRVAALEAGDSAIVDTPSTQVVLVQPGLYRIDVSPDQQTTALTIREGEATAQVTAGLQQVLAGMSAIIVNAATTSAVFSVAYAPDAFDAWNASREGYYQQARGTTYVSPEMVGYDDLANYGTWQPDAAYGNVWYPNDVVPGWAPYSDGYWTTIPLFGLTWVDHARWGYAPFHYGRWARVHNRWGWLPGNYVARPVWAPALVAWTSVGVSGGGAVHGWVPLGFREPYRPWWGACGARCWDRYNRPYQIDPRERDRYRDHAPPPERRRHARRAIASVRRRAMRRACMHRAIPYCRRSRREAPRRGSSCRATLHRGSSCRATPRRCRTPGPAACACTRRREASSKGRSRHTGRGRASSTTRRTRRVRIRGRRAPPSSRRRGCPLRNA